MIPVSSTFTYTVLETEVNLFLLCKEAVAANVFSSCFCCLQHSDQKTNLVLNAKPTQRSAALGVG